ncbi:MAG: hypothetical protein B6D37_07760 [Sphingobacteriales bacterium UTBCD1]|jgi:K+-transporting ATPase c subunit|nr:MAG: hypothetical protein B6D37_07760 [Sphingobacteriales bacterium UTBCD1]
MIGFSLFHDFINLFDMNFFSHLRKKIRESKKFTIIFGIIYSVIFFLLFRLFFPEYAHFSDLILLIITGFVGDFYIRKKFLNKKKNDHQQLK